MIFFDITGFQRCRFLQIISISALWRYLRLQAHGTVCPRCGLEYGMDVMKCVYCGQGMSGTVQ